MIYVITDNQFLFAGIGLLLSKYGLGTTRLSVNDLRTHEVRKEHVFFIECAFHEGNYHLLSQLRCSGARVCYLMQRSIAFTGVGSLLFIDITTQLTIYYTNGAESRHCRCRNSRKYGIPDQPGIHCCPSRSLWLFR